jgi:hypothetical protein
MRDAPWFTVDGSESCASPVEGEVVEISLLLPGWEVSILEMVAHQRGLTTGAMVRHLVRDFLVDVPTLRDPPV